MRKPSFLPAAALAMTIINCGTQDTNASNQAPVDQASEPQPENVESNSTVLTDSTPTPQAKKTVIITDTDLAEINTKIQDLVNENRGHCDHLFFVSQPGAFPGEMVEEIKLNHGGIRIASVNEPVCVDQDGMEICTTNFNVYSPELRPQYGFGVLRICIEGVLATSSKMPELKSELPSSVDIRDAINGPLVQ